MAEQPIDPAANTLAARVFAPLIRYVRDCGLDAAELLRESGLPEDPLADPDYRVRHADFRHFVTLCTERTGDPAFGLHAGEYTMPGDLGLLEHLVRTSETPREIIEKVSRYSTLVAAQQNPIVEIRGDTAVWRCNPAVGSERDVQGLEGTLSEWITLARSIRGHTLSPLEVRFPHPEPAYSAEHTRIFRSPVKFDCDETALVFEFGGYEEMLAAVDRKVADAVRHRADEALEEIDSAERFSKRVRSELLRDLASTEVTAETVARVLHMSGRTLRRRLKEEGTSFQTLRDDARRERALEYTKEGRLSIGEISFLLGFSETSAFHRAFRRWTGTTPADHRRQP